MYPYFTDIIIKINIALAAIVVVLAMATITSVSLNAVRTRKRNGALLDIKKNVYGLLLSGTKLSTNVCNPVSAEATPEEFLAVTTNRNRDAVFFTKEEQDIFTGCYSTPGKIAKLKRTAMRSFSKWKRIEALIALAYLRSEESVGILKRYVRSRDDDMRYFSILYLGQIKNSESAKTLTTLLKIPGYPRRKIVSILETFPPEPVSGYTVRLLKEKSSDTRFWALKLLSRLDKGRHSKEISGYLKDPFEEVRAAACECLGNSGKREISDALALSLKDESWLVRSAAIKAMSELLGEDCIPKVIGLLQDSSLSVLSALKEVLIRHIKAAMPYIDKIYSGEDRMAKMVCVEAVEEARKGGSI